MTSTPESGDPVVTHDGLDVRPTAAPRAAVAGLVWLGAGEETLLLGETREEGGGTPDCWSATATVAHNSDFREDGVST